MTRLKVQGCPVENTWRRIRVILSAFTVVLLCLAGCRGDSSNQTLDDVEEEDDHFSLLEGIVHFSIVERHDETDEAPMIELQLETEAIYPNSGNSILYLTHMRDSTLHVRVYGVYEGGVFALVGPATGRIPLPQAPSHYSLEFRYQGDDENFDIQITDDRIVIQGFDPVRFIPQDSLRWRYPQPSFACLSTPPNDADGPGPAIHDSLMNTGLFTELQFETTGVVPYLVPNNWSASFYRYQDEADFDSAAAVLSRFIENEAPGEPSARIELRNWRNVSQTSW